MKNRISILLMVAAGFLMLTVHALAHHGQAAYDMTKTISLRGVVSEFNWANPHSILQLDVRNEKGEKEKWLIATGPTGTLERCGWSSNGQISGSLVKNGDEVTVIGNRVRSGANMMLLSKLVLPAGKQLTVYCNR